MQVGLLEGMLLAYGLPVLPENTRYYHSFERQSSVFVGEMIRHGYLFLAPRFTPYSPYSDVTYGGIDTREIVYADERVLSQIDWPVEVRQLTLAHAPQAPVAPTTRRASLVTLDLMTVTRTLAEMKPLSITQKGEIRLADQRQFVKRLGWEESPSFDGYRFPDMPHAVLTTWRQADWLHADQYSDTLSVTMESFMRQSHLQQLTLLANAFTSNVSWCELMGIASYTYPDILRARFIFFHCLRALPDTGHFYTLPDFMAAIYDRVGEALETKPIYRLAKPFKMYNSNEKQYQQDLAQWRTQHKAEWIQHESAFGEAALSSWLYWLGLIELGRLADDTLAFRLTDTARAIFAGEEEETPPASASVSEHPAWVVQPNYDIIAYLDAVSPAQLTFLEVHAERRQAEAHTAHFQLTRDSVYRGLQRGATAEDLLNTLRTGARVALPQNVEREIRDWAGQREQVTISRQKRLIAFPTPETRALALEAGLKGTPLGDHYVLVAAETQIKAALKTVYGLQTIPTIDYAQAPEKCLQAGENGTLKLIKENVDLLLRGQLARCTEEVDATHWRLTLASLARVRQAGVTAKTLLAFLQERVQGTLPPMLEVVIGNALGTRDVVEADTAFVLRVPNKKLHTAITSSAKLKPLLLDVPGPDTIVVSLANLDKFKAQLDWLGVKLTSYSQVEKRPDWHQTVRDAKTQQRRRGY